jgi:hypothetical protein
MKLKEEIELLLESLKNQGISRTAIEEDLGYSENYIDQVLSKGGNKKFLAALKRYMLQKATPPKVQSRHEVANSSASDAVAILTEWREDVEAKYQDSNKRELALIAIINDYLKTMGVNLSRGQQELKEQILSSTSALGQLMMEQRGTLPAPTQRKGSGLSKKQGEVDGKGKGH